MNSAAIARSIGIRPDIAIAAVPDDERVIEVVHGRTYVAGQQIEHLAQFRRFHAIG